MDRLNRAFYRNETTVLLRNGAATAVAQGGEVATLNAKEFARVPGLSILPASRYLRR